MAPSTDELAPAQRHDLIVIGAGAAGIATAIFSAHAAPHLRIRCLDGARRIGAKILVSGGSRCNVTNRVVTERDFWGGSARFVRRVLKAYPAPKAAAFFERLGVALHEEEDGKLFPDTNSSRTVVDALLREAARVGVTIAAERRVTAVRLDTSGFAIETACGERYLADAVVLATGGRSLPKTGSDGFGYQLAAGLGHGHVATSPALAPLLVDGYAELAGVSMGAAMTLRPAATAEDPRRSTAALSSTHRAPVVRLEGPMLWTHFGVSGPLALNMSRHWHRARIEQRAVEVSLDLLPGEPFERIEEWWQSQARLRPRARVSTVLATRLPGAVADAWIRSCGLAEDATLAHLAREERRRLTHALLDSVLPVRDSRGYNYAEVTAGGVPLDEVDPATMESRITPGLYFTGEILDADGRLGGCNFQWAWSTAWVAAQAIARALRPASA